MAAPVWQSTQTATGNGLGSITITKPTSTASGDLLICHLACADPGSTYGTITAPAGWTIIRQDYFNTSNLLYKVAGGSEAANYTFTQSGGGEISGAISRITGAHATHPINAHSGTNTGLGSSTTAVAPSLTTTVNDCLLMQCVGVWNSSADPATTFTAAGTMTERWEVGTTANDIYGTGDTETFATAGATGTRTNTLSASHSGVSTSMIAIAPTAASASAIVPSLLTESSSATDATSYATASITATSGRLVLLAVSHGNTGGATNIPTATGGGLTWTQVTTVQNTNHRTTVFSGTGTPSAGAVTIDFAGVTQHNCCWSITEFIGGTSVVQSNTATGTSTTPTVTLSNTVGAGNLTYAVMSQNVTTTGPNPGQYFVQLGKQVNQSTPSNRQIVEFSGWGANPTNATSGSVQYAIVGLEIAPFISATASFSGTGSFTATAVWTAQATSTFSGTGSFTATAKQTFFPSASFSGVGAFTATAVKQHNVTSSFAGVGAFSGTATSWDPAGDPVVTAYLEISEGVWTELTELRNGDIDRGRQHELDTFKVGSCTLSFNNKDRLYDPVYVDGPLYGSLKINRRIRVDAFQNGITRTIFFGYIDSINNERIQPRHNIATIRASDAFKVLNKATVNGTSFSAVLPGSRINTVLDLIPIEAGLRDIDTGTVNLQAMVDVSSTLLSHVQNVAVTEFGALFVQADGTVRFKDRDSAAAEPIQAIFGEDAAEFHYSSISTQFDDTLIRNPVSVDRVGGIMQTVEDPLLRMPPPDGYGNNQFTLSGTYHNTDADALAASEYILSQYREPKRRIIGMTLVSPKHEDAVLFYPQMLGRELTESIMVIERPQSVGDRVEQKSIIEGIQHSFSPKTWVTTWALSPSYVPDATFHGTSSFTATATVLPQWRSAQTAYISGAAPQNSLTITKPVGTVAGDLLVAFIAVEEEGTINKPSAAWTLLRSTDWGFASISGFRSYYMIAGASEPANYTWVNTASGNDWMQGALSRITGADQVSPINVSSQHKEDFGGADATGISVTTTVPNCLLIFGCAAAGTISITPPAGMTERWDDGQGFEGATVTVASAGATGDKVASHSNTWSAAHLIAITPG